ncbi:MAG: ornithine carbamoyltransferase, partial [Planctomycetota bacterium]
VVNALSDREHPCQALADLLTLREALGSLPGKRLVFIGDGNNVCVSLMLAAAAVGMVFTAITPDDRALPEQAITAARSAAEASGGRVRLSHDPGDARGHHAVYTDTWRSMGGADESPEALRQRFGPYAVNTALISLAADGIDGDPCFLHCLPASRGEEVEAAVIDGPLSLVYDQAENRMHAQNALVRWLLGRAPNAAAGDS